jgi:acyl-homoserine lactone synthase
MALIFEAAAQPLVDATLRAMFEARKRVFVDLLGWDVPVIAGRFEIDQFDDAHAVYLVVTDREGRHLGSARLLETVRPHLLDTLFPSLCAGTPPRGQTIREITRFCLDTRQTARERRATRDRLVAALVDHALAAGLSGYTGVAEMGWFQQILAFGWRCRPLGLPALQGGRMLGALSIDIDPDTPGLLSANGIACPAQARADPALAA